MRMVAHGLLTYFHTVSTVDCATFMSAAQNKLKPFAEAKIDSYEERKASAIKIVAQQLNEQAKLEVPGVREWALWYAGVSPGKAAASVSQFNEYWGGLVVKMPEDILAGFDGSTATLHYQVGTDTKNTGTQVPEVGQRKSEWTRIVPSVNIRYNEQFDIQAAYMIAEDKNWSLAATPGASFKYSGIALEAGYMPTELWHLGLHYDQYASSDNNTTGQNAGKPVFEYQRIVPAVTYILNYNMRFSLYYEKDLTPDRKDAAGKVIPLIDRITFNVRMMI